MRAIRRHMVVVKLPFLRLWAILRIVQASGIGMGEGGWQHPSRRYRKEGA